MKFIASNRISITRASALELDHYEKLFLDDNVEYFYRVWRYHSDKHNVDKL